MPDLGVLVSICILNRNQRTLLNTCLGSCMAELERSKISGEIIVVDNASEDGSAEMVAALFPAVRIIRNQKNEGFSSANNRAIRLSSGRYLLVLNNDTVVLPDSLRILVDYLEAHPRVAAVGPKLLNPDGSVQQGYHRSFPPLAEPALLLFGLHRFWPGNVWFERARRLNERLVEPTPIDQIAGCALLLRRATLESVGLFDESFHYWFEDVELCHRIQRHGWHIYYIPRAQIIHHGGATFAVTPIPEQLMLYSYGVLLYFRKQKGFFRYVVLRGLTVLAVLMRLSVAGFLAVSPDVKLRRRWRGKLRAYWRMLQMVVLNRRPPQNPALGAV